MDVEESRALGPCFGVSNKYIFELVSSSCPFFPHIMEMKKRISLELRNKTPAEVRSWTFNYLFSPEMMFDRNLSVCRSVSPAESES